MEKKNVRKVPMVFIQKIKCSVPWGMQSPKPKVQRYAILILYSVPAFPWPRCCLCSLSPPHIISSPCLCPEVFFFLLYSSFFRSVMNQLRRLYRIKILKKKSSDLPPVALFLSLSFPSIISSLLVGSQLFKGRSEYVTPAS